MSGTYRHGRVYCQVADCRRRAVRAVEIELPTDWQGTFGFRVLSITVGACVEHGRALTAHASALLEARGEQHDLARVITGAVETEAAARRLAAELEGALLEAEGALAYQRERADNAERALRLRLIDEDPCPACGGDHDRTSRADCPLSGAATA